MSTTVTATLGFVGLSFALSGMLLVLRRSAVCGVLLVAAGLLTLVAAVLRTRDDPEVALLLTLTAGIGLLPLTLAAYPTPRRHHPVDLVAAVLLLAAIPAVLLTPVAPEVTGYVAALVLIAHTWWRVETSSGAERTALLWMVTTVTTLTLVIGVTSFALDGAEASLAPAFLLTCSLGPVLVLGVSQPDIIDVRGLVVQIAVFASALLVDVSIFFLLVGFLAAFGVDEPSIGALAVLGGLAAAAFHPTQVLMRGVMDELLFGRRPDPLGAATTLAGRVGPDLTDTMEVIRQTLVLPWVALHVDGELVASAGTEVAHRRDLDLGGADRLLVGMRAGDLSLSAHDRNVLGLVVPLLAQNLRSRALADALQESRERTITVIEEERRRLRRDLHDGLGPRLTGIAFSTDAVRNLLRGEPDRADDLLRELRREITVAIDDIRRLVYAMRPPALDELGLVPALRQQTLGLRTPTGAPLAVAVDAPDQLHDLSAAVEVAAYRIVMEALTNVVRHSAAGSASVALVAVGDRLRIDVTDTGGQGPHWVPGVGLASMRERAVELGGTFHAGPGPAGGRVCAELPTSKGTGAGRGG